MTPEALHALTLGIGALTAAAALALLARRRFRDEGTPLGHATDTGLD